MSQTDSLTDEQLMARGMTVAGAVAQWYFARDKWRDIGALPVTGSYCRAVRYHTGSLALSSPLPMSHATDAT